MKTKEALEIVLNLAQQNALDIDRPLDPPLELEARKQHTAINIINQVNNDVKDGLISLPLYESIINLPCYGILLYTQHGVSRIMSDLHKHDDDKEHKARIDALESLILAHFSAGIDVGSDKYVKGIETAVEAIFNRT